MQIISIAIQKGGSGKTTTTLNLAAALRQLGKKILLIDLDPQANLTQSMGFDEPEPNLYHLLKEEFDGEASDIEGALLESNGMHLIPASLELASAELELVSIFGREKILKTMLESIDGDYDFVLIDCPPAIGMLTANALVASHHVLMPLQAEYLPLKGVHSFMKTFNKIKRQINPDLNVLGFLLTKFDSRKKMNRNILDQLTEEYGKKVFKTKIRTNIALAQAQEWGVDIFTYDKSAKGAVDHMQLAREFLKKIK